MSNQLDATREGRTRTVAELAKEVLEVQNACNLSGVVLSWGQAILDLRANLSGADQSTSAINHHPINVMWAEKVSELTGAGFHHNADAFQTVKVLAAGA